MAKYTKPNKTSAKTRDEAMAVARSTQKQGQTKEQTKLIAQGIQKGIEIYKKQRKEKTRELDKRLKKAATTPLASQTTAADPVTLMPPKQNSRLPWVLLALSWALFALYIAAAE
jgi:hypothetical protein